jgi:hypothetical protein
MDQRAAGSTGWHGPIFGPRTVPGPSTRHGGLFRHGPVARRAKRARARSGRAWPGLVPCRAVLARCSSLAGRRQERKRNARPRRQPHLTTALPRPSPLPPPVFGVQLSISPDGLDPRPALHFIFLFVLRSPHGLAVALLSLPANLRRHGMAASCHGSMGEPERRQTLCPAGQPLRKGRFSGASLQEQAPAGYISESLDYSHNLI